MTKQKKKKIEIADPLAIRMTTVLVTYLGLNMNLAKMEKYIFQDIFARNLGELGCHQLERKLTLIKSVL